MKESNQRPEVEEVVRSLDRKERSLVQQLKRQSASQGSWGLTDQSYVALLP